MAKARTRNIVRRASRAWTKDDVRQMKNMAKAKSGVKKIAKALKRTPGATTVMAAKLGGIAVYARLDAGVKNAAQWG